MRVLAIKGGQEKMVLSLKLLDQVPLSNSHWRVFNPQELTASEELTGTD